VHKSINKIDDGDDNWDEDNGEKALVGFSKQFKGRCRKCGKYGHKGANCRSNNQVKGSNDQASTKSTSFKGKCFYCNKPGHRKQDCCKRQQDKGTQQEEYGETAFVCREVHSGDNEYLVEDSFFDQFECLEADESDDDYLDIDSLQCKKSMDESIESGLLITEDGEVEWALMVEDYESMSYDNDKETTEKWTTVCKGKKKVQNEKGQYTLGVPEATSTHVGTPSANYYDCLVPDWEMEVECELDLLVTRDLLSKAQDPEQTWRYQTTEVDPETKIVAIPWVDTRKQHKKKGKKQCQSEYHSWNLDAYIDTELDHGLTANAGVNLKFTKNTWIADSGASCHMGPTDDGMYDTTEIDNPIKIGNGRTLRAIKIGKLKKTIKQNDGSTLDIMLEEYKHVPSLQMHLFSITKALDAGWQLGNDGVKIILRKGSNKVTFDRIMKTDRGKLCGVEILSRQDSDTVTARQRYRQCGNFHSHMGHQ
jgi:hypothetical protein